MNIIGEELVKSLTARVMELREAKRRLDSNTVSVVDFTQTHKDQVEVMMIMYV